MNMPPATTREDLIREAADTIVRADSVDPEGGRARAEWEAVNQEGWTLDLGTHLDEQYERHEGVVFSPSEFERVFALAQDGLAVEAT